MHHAVGSAHLPESSTLLLVSLARKGTRQLILLLVEGRLPASRHDARSRENFSTFQKGSAAESQSKLATPVLSD